MPPSGESKSNDMSPLAGISQCACISAGRPSMSASTHERIVVGAGRGRADDGRADVGGTAFDVGAVAQVADALGR